MMNRFRVFLCIILLAISPAASAMDFGNIVTCFFADRGKPLRMVQTIIKEGDYGIKSLLPSHAGSDAFNYYRDRFSFLKKAYPNSVKCEKTETYQVDLLGTSLSLGMILYSFTTDNGTKRVAFPISDDGYLPVGWGHQVMLDKFISQNR